MQPYPEPAPKSHAQVPPHCRGRGPDFRSVQRSQALNATHPADPSSSFDRPCLCPRTCPATALLPRPCHRHFARTSSSEGYPARSQNMRNNRCENTPSAWFASFASARRLISQLGYQHEKYGKAAPRPFAPQSPHSPRTNASISAARLRTASLFHFAPAWMARPTAIVVCIPHST